MVLKQLWVVGLIAPVLCSAQTFSPPPLVEAPPPSDAPRAPPPPQQGPGAGPATPPPPGYSVPPSGSPQYGQPGAPSPYMPYYGAPMQKPGPEYGLMVTESLFGMLTAAGVGLVPYFLLFDLLKIGQGLDPTISNLIFLGIFAAVPLAVSETEGQLANGSRYYIVDGWVAPLAGLLAEAAVVGLKYLLIGHTLDDGTAVLLVGTVVFVPLAEMAAINLFKFPRYKTTVGPVSGLMTYNPTDGIHVGMPMPQPFLGTTSVGLKMGMQFPLFAGRF